MKRIMVLGSNGLVGRHVVRELGREYDLITVGRHPTSDHFWSIDAPFPTHLLDQVDGVINLIGAPIMDRRWTTQRWIDMKYSRIQSTQGLVDGILQLSNPRSIHVLNASAIGYYDWDVPVTEESGVGTHPISTLVQQWERPLTMGGPFLETRLRLGMVLAPDGGALQPLRQLAAWGLGGQQGGGNQWVSWVHIRDVVAAIRHCIQEPVLGAVNVVAPQPVTNGMWMSHIRKGVGRGWGLPAPSWGLRLVLGQRADMLIKGHRVIPKRLMDTGFTHQFFDLEEAIRDVWGVMGEGGGSQ